MSASALSINAGNERGSHSPETDEQHSKLAVGGRDFFPVCIRHWCVLSLADTSAADTSASGGAAQRACVERFRTRVSFFT